MVERVKNQPNWIQWITGIIVLVMFVGLIFGVFEKEQEPVVVPTAAEIASEIVIPIPEALNNENVEKILAQVFKEDDWEDRIEAIATEEWSDKNNKDIYRAIADIYGDIDDEDDIEYVKEDESSDFRSMDADDGDGFVTQYLKVKYETDDGDRKRVYLTVESEVDDEDLEDQVITTTDR